MPNLLERVCELQCTFYIVPMLFSKHERAARIFPRPVNNCFSTADAAVALTGDLFTFGKICHCQKPKIKGRSDISGATMPKSLHIHCDQERYFQLLKPSIPVTGNMTLWLCEILGFYHRTIKKYFFKQQQIASKFFFLISIVCDVFLLSVLFYEVAKLFLWLEQ